MNDTEPKTSIPETNRSTHDDSHSDPNLDGDSQKVETEASAKVLARKGTGPRTILGKQRSRYNALKHGLFSRVLLLDDESKTEYELLITGLRDDYQPEGVLEESLVENLAVLMWRKRRLLKAERAEILNSQKYAALDLSSSIALDDEHVKQAALVPPQEILERLLRYEANLNREIDRTLRQLERLQQMRGGNRFPLRGRSKFPTEFPTEGSQPVGT